MYKPLPVCALLAVACMTTPAPGQSRNNRTIDGTENNQDHSEWGFRRHPAAAKSSGCLSR